MLVDCKVGIAKCIKILAITLHAGGQNCGQGVDSASLDFEACMVSACGWQGALYFIYETVQICTVYATRTRYMQAHYGLLAVALESVSSAGLLRSVKFAILAPADTTYIAA